LCSGFVVGWFFMCLRLVFSVVWWVGPSDGSLNFPRGYQFNDSRANYVLLKKLF
jgi:hypothetical protein